MGTEQLLPVEQSPPGPSDLSPLQPPRSAAGNPLMMPNSSLQMRIGGTFGVVCLTGGSNLITERINSVPDGDGMCGFG